MTATGYAGVPGIGADYVTTEREIYWGGSQGQIAILWNAGAVLDATLTDAGNTPTTVIRPGMLLGIITATGKYAQYDADAIDGTEVVAGILDTEMVMVDAYGVACERVYRVCVARAPVKASQLLIKGVALVGATDETVARAALDKAKFVLDDDPFAALTS